VVVAHTGNARACSQAFADVLSVLHSWARRSLGIANVRSFSQALLYGLLYKRVGCEMAGRGFVTDLIIGKVM
jgi:hypothetical protein